MPDENIVENATEEEVLSTFATVNGEEAEIVKFTGVLHESIDDQIRPLARLLAETDLKNSVFAEGRDVEAMKTEISEKKLTEIKNMLTKGEALVARVNGKIVAVQGISERIRYNGRPLMQLTKGATLEEYARNDIAKSLAKYLLQAHITSNPNGVFISFSRNEYVIEALRRNGWHALGKNSQHPIYRTYIEGYSLEVKTKFETDGYQLLYFDPKSEILPSDVIAVEPISEVVLGRVEGVLEE